MLTGPSRKIGCLLATGLLAGCAQTDNMFPRRTTLGSLKTSVSQLEYQNEQLRTEVAQLKSVNHEIEDRLVQEEAENGQLSARLDDARYELSRRGVDTGDDHASASRSEHDGTNPGVTIPAGRSTRKRRKTPFAQIPGRTEPEPEPTDNQDDVRSAPPTRIRAKDEFGPQSNRIFDDPGGWLPIAKGTSESSPTVR